MLFLCCHVLDLEAWMQFLPSSGNNLLKIYSIAQYKRIVERNVSFKDIYQHNVYEKQTYIEHKKVN